MKSFLMVKVVGVFAMIALLFSFDWKDDLSDSFPPVSNERGLPIFMRAETNWADSILATLSLEEKIAQSFMVAATPNKGEEHLKEVDSLIRQHRVGGVILFQGNMVNTRRAIERFQNESEVPLLMGIDAEWGLDMRLWKGKDIHFS